MTEAEAALRRGLCVTARVCKIQGVLQTKRRKEVRRELTEYVKAA
jgi:hypothetical protein